MSAEDSFDELDVVAGYVCNSWGSEARNFLEMIGAKPDEIDELIADNMDSFF